MTKFERQEIAQAHHELMIEKYGYMHFQTNLYTDKDNLNITRKSLNTTIEVVNNDTVSEILKQSESVKLNIAALNFASFQKPGGGFINGSMAQEEALCHYSNLYEILLEQTEYYEYNEKHKHGGAYENRLLYSQNVIFEKDDKKGFCDIITCACPNKSVLKYTDKLTWDNNKILHSRIKFVLDVANFEEVNTLILGAWGCGVFMQNPKEVATLFKQVLEENKDKYGFEKVIFAIPGGENYDVFKSILG